MIPGHCSRHESMDRSVFSGRLHKAAGCRMFASISGGLMFCFFRDYYLQSGIAFAEIRAVRVPIYRI